MKKAIGFIFTSLIVLSALAILPLNLTLAREASVYNYSITDITQTSPDTIVVSAECLFCGGCNPNDPGSPNHGDGCTPFACGYPPSSFPSYAPCTRGSPNGRFAAIRISGSFGSRTQKLVCDQSNWPLDSLWSHNFVFSGLTFTPGETISVEADFYCSYCRHWYASPQSFVPAAYTIVFVPLNWQGDLSTFGAYVSRQANFLIDSVGALTDANTEILTVDENLVLDFDKTENANSFEGWSAIVLFAIEHDKTGDRYVALTNENIWGRTMGGANPYGTAVVVDVSDEYVELTAHELGHTWGTLDEYNHVTWEGERDWVLANMPPSTAYNSYPVDDDPRMPYPPPDNVGPVCKGRSFGLLGLGRCTMGYAFRSSWPHYRGFCPECGPIVDDYISASGGYWSSGLAEVVVTFFKNGAAPEVDRITGIPRAGKSMRWAGSGNHSVQVFSEAGGLLYNSNVSYSFLWAPSQPENGTAVPSEIDAITVAWLVPAFSERRIMVVLRDNIADQIITSQELVLAPIDEAWIDYKTTDRITYDFGDTIEVTTEVETTSASMDVTLDVTLLDPDNVAQDYRSWTGTIHPGPDPVARYLMIPSLGITGTWTVYVVVLNSTGHFQDSESNFITVGIPADTTPPTTTLTISYPQYIDVAGNMYITSSTSSTILAADDPGGSGVASTAYRIRNATYDSGWATSAPPIEFYLTGLDDGEYFIDYNSTDNVGNVETPNMQEVIFDNTSPTTTLTIGSPKYFLYVTCVTPETIFSLEAADAGSDCNMTSYCISNATYDSGWEICCSTFNFSSLDYGIYTISFNSTDNLGNVEDTLNVTIQVRANRDMNGDNVINMKDIAIAAQAFGTTPGHPRWNPNVDMNRDNKINLIDIAAIGKDFGIHLS